jgi:hypothetical protein
VAHLGQLDQLYGLMPGGPAKLVVLVEDNGPIHVSKLSSPALAARVDWLTVEWLSKLAPELNDSEVVWYDLKAPRLGHQTSTEIATLDQAIHDPIKDPNSERMVVSLAKPQISAQMRTVSTPTPRNSGRRPSSMVEVDRVVPNQIVACFQPYWTVRSALA